MKYCRCAAAFIVHADGAYACRYRCPSVESLRSPKRAKPPEPQREKGFRVEQQFTEAARRLGLVGGKCRATTPRGMVRNRMKLTKGRTS